MKFPHFSKFLHFSRQDRFWLWYLLVILGLYIIGAVIWQVVDPQAAALASTYV